MTPRALALTLAERFDLPDALLRAGIGRLVGRTARALHAAPPETEANFAAAMRARPVADTPEAANRQHYEVPSAFFERCLGPARKYSSCLYPTGRETLAEAELCALAETAAHAALADGQDILELGCGWGSLTLFMAERFPAARITAVSNSSTQRHTIESLARQRSLTNVRVLTADMNGFAPAATYDRIVSVEMFEHMANWPALLARVHAWLKPGGKLFLHVFSHATTPYAFSPSGDDWIGQYFFTGGIMPSHGLLPLVADGFVIEDTWRWPGTHYARTARAWLRNFDTHRAACRDILEPVYGAETARWLRRWRLFFLATEGLFGFGGGTPWGVSHYRLRK